MASSPWKHKRNKTQSHYKKYFFQIHKYFKRKRVFHVVMRWSLILMHHAMKLLTSVPDSFCSCSGTQRDCGFSDVTSPTCIYAGAFESQNAFHNLLNPSRMFASNFERDWTFSSSLLRIYYLLNKLFKSIPKDVLNKISSLDGTLF